MLLHLSFVDEEEGSSNGTVTKKKKKNRGRKKRGGMAGPAKAASTGFLAGEEEFCSIVLPSTVSKTFASLKNGLHQSSLAEVPEESRTILYIQKKNNTSPPTQNNTSNETNDGGVVVVNGGMVNGRRRRKKKRKKATTKSKETSNKSTTVHNGKVAVVASKKQQPQPRTTNTNNNSNSNNNKRFTADLNNPAAAKFVVQSNGRQYKIAPVDNNCNGQTDHNPIPPPNHLPTKHNGYYNNNLNGFTDTHQTNGYHNGYHHPSSITNNQVFSINLNYNVNNGRNVVVNNGAIPPSHLQNGYHHTNGNGYYHSDTNDSNINNNMTPYPPNGYYSSSEHQQAYYTSPSPPSSYPSSQNVDAFGRWDRMTAYS